MGEHSEGRGETVGACGAEEVGQAESSRAPGTAPNAQESAGQAESSRAPGTAPNAQESAGQAENSRASGAAPGGEGTATHFIRSVVVEDQKTGRYGGRVVTRFPPEPNGYMHIGHAKSICLNFSLAEEFGGSCNLRFDDTNPTTEDIEFVESMQRDIRWLGFQWTGLYYASDYFEQMYQLAEQLIRDGHAYVCSLSEEEVRAYRGSVTEHGKESPGRTRSVDENLDIFRRMRAGEFLEGAYTLRARIDMAAANMKLRDPPLYRIRHAHHYRTGDAWHIYPMYDYAHPVSDAIEGITHSICTLEFENNRDVYDWVIEKTGFKPPRPQQYEFARLKLNYTVMSKRKLLTLVRNGMVSGWDDPRMPTISGMRRAGYTPEAIRDFCDRIGVARANSTVDFALLERCVRDDLHPRAPRVMGVLAPLRVVIENYPEGQLEWLDCPYFPGDMPGEQSRKVPFSRVLYLEREDFMEHPSKGYHRLSPGQEVRLRYAYYIRCVGVDKDPDTGEVVGLRCTYDPTTRGGSSPDGRKVKGTLHWVSADQAIDAEVRLYDRLFQVENPDDAEDFKTGLNPDSLRVLSGVKLEPSLSTAAPGDRFQFERQGFFCVDQDLGAGGRPVFSRTVTLKDSWVKSAAHSPGLSKPSGEAGKPSGDETTLAGEAEKPSGDAKKAKGRPGKAPRAERAEAPARSPEVLARIHAYQSRFGLPAEDAERLAPEEGLLAMLEAAVATHPNARGVAGWIVHELLPELKDRRLETLPFGGSELGELVALIDDQTLSTAIARQVFADMMRSGGRPGEIVAKQGLRQVDDAEALEPIIDQVIAANPETVARFREGKTSLLGFFVGQVLKATQGRANPQRVNEILRQKL